MYNNFVTRFFLIAVLLSIGVTALYSQTNKQILGQDDQQLNTITTAVPFLMIAPDSRAGAMGDCGVATSPDANSMHWNPAKYAFVKDDMGFSVSYSPWLRALVNDISLAYLSGYKRLDDMQTLAASLRYFSMGVITFTDKAGEKIDDFTPNEFAVDATYSRKFSKYLSGAVSLRYIYSNLTGNIFVGGSQSRPGQTGAADVSVFYERKIKVNKRDAVMAFGTNISNIGAKISYTETIMRDFIPINWRLGAAYSVELDKYNTIMVTADINKLLVPSPPILLLDTNGHNVKVALMGII